jgi:hypothetical protein
MLNPPELILSLSQAEINDAAAKSYAELVCGSDSSVTHFLAERPPFYGGVRIHQN